MTKLVIFDLDGVLYDSKEIHYLSLNNALQEYGEDFVISESEHLRTFDGLPTNKKGTLRPESITKSGSGLVQLSRTKHDFMRLS